MDRTTIHIASFGVIYDTPKQRDIFGSVKVSIHNIYFTFVIGAFKNLISSFANVFAFVTGLRSVTRTF